MTTYLFPYNAIIWINNISLLLNVQTILQIQFQRIKGQYEKIKRKKNASNDSFKIIR